MKFLSVLSLILILAQQTIAGLPPTSVQGQSDASAQTKFNFQVPYSQKTDIGGVKALFETGNKNLLANSGFENTSATSSWTVVKNSGSTFSCNGTNTSINDGLQVATCAESAATGCIQQDVTPAVDTSTTSMEYSTWIKTAETDVQVCARQNGASIGCQSVPGSNTWQQVVLNFPGTAAGTSIGLSVCNTSIASSSFSIDDTYVGKARNVGTVSQSSLYGSIVWPATASCTWTKSVTSPSSYSAVAACTTPVGSNLIGNASAPATKIPAITFSTLPAGNYLFQVRGALINSTPNTQSCAYRIFDGTNGSQFSNLGFSSSNPMFPGFTALMSYASSQSNVTFDIQPASGDGSTAQTCNVDASASNRSLQIDVFRFPSNSEIAVKANTIPNVWSGYQDSISSGCQVASATFADYSSCVGITLHQTQANNISCVTLASGLPGITCTFPSPGLYGINGWAVITPQATTGRYGVRLVDGTGAVIAPGTSMQNNGASATNTMPFNGVYNVTSANQVVTFKVQSAINTAITLDIDQGPGISGMAALNWNVFGLTQNIQAPVLVGGDNCTNTSTITTNTTASPGTQCYVCDATGGNVTLTLPAVAGTTKGVNYTLKKKDSSANTCILAGNSSELIDTLNTYTMGGQNQAVKVTSDTAQWWTLSGRMSNGVQKYTNYLNSGTTWTSPAITTGFSAATSCKFTLIGGGGAGAGSTSVTGGAPGGGAGGTIIHYATGLSPNTGYTYAIGSGGTGSSGATGGNGGNSTLTIGATTYTAGGGTGGTTGSRTAGGAGGTTTNGTIGIPGQAGGATVQTQAPSGFGGSTILGSGGGQLPVPSTTQLTGLSATGCGAGGGGSATAGTGSNAAGGPGANGCLLIECTN